MPGVFHQEGEMPNLRYMGKQLTPEIKVMIKEKSMVAEIKMIKLLKT